ncbi:NAD(P)H-quinone oxidoreductase [Streptomyces sp. NPDC005728]|uniref:NAD(P)H-quinone oxidoreductase n=1 Tax=Streptomyces sp. NPDC005728 TaxID=3157054 RepID=UPI00340BC459
MGAVLCNAPGGPEVMRWHQAERPEAGPGEVVVRVAATAVNRADLSQRAGRYPVPPGTSPILGLECSGRVHSVGEGVSDVEAGTSVMALVTGGAYAEYVAVPVPQLMPIPAGVTLADAASLPEALCTVYANLVMDGGLRPGQSVLVHGGGSGIGTMAIQLIRALGARPMVTVGSERKGDLCMSLGAEAVINYRTQDFVSEVRDRTAGAGVDLLLDCVGGSYLSRNVEALADDGTMLIIGLQGGNGSRIDLGPVMRRRLTVRGSTLRARPPRHKAAIVDATARALTGLIETGRIRPVVDRRFPIARAADAHRYVESGQNFGKVVLEVQDTSSDGHPAHLTGAG